MVARQVRRSVVMSNLRVGLLPWIQTGLRSERGKTSFTAPSAPLLSNIALNSPGPGSHPLDQPVPRSHSLCELHILRQFDLPEVDKVFQLAGRGTRPAVRKPVCAL